MNDSRHKEIRNFTQRPHHRSNTFVRQAKELKGKNIIAPKMVERTLEQSIDADYLLTGSWTPSRSSSIRREIRKPPVIARIANNECIWQLKGRRKTINGIYNMNPTADTARSAMIFLT